MEALRARQFMVFSDTLVLTRPSLPEKDAYSFFRRYLFLGDHQKTAMISVSNVMSTKRTCQIFAGTKNSSVTEISL